MSEKFKPKQPEQKEVRQGVELRVVEPDGDKGFMVGFDGETKEECQAYNCAIGNVLKEAGLSPFHQIGTTPFGQNEPGYHAWEIWKESTAQNLKSLLPKIEEKAKEFLE